MAQVAVANPSDRTDLVSSRRRKPVGRTEDRATSRGRHDMKALAELSWPEGPLTLMASDFADLECEGPARTLRSLLDLCHRIERDEILILNLEYLSWEATANQVDARRVNMLCETVERTCLQSRTFVPRIAFETRDQSLDMRIRLTTCH